ncbi:MAG: iron-sulfur cluster repair di-iron protein [Microthrixaceae bacterium]
MTDQPTSTLHGETSPDATTLGDLVTANPTAAQVLQRHGLDFCCGGRSTLAEACQKADVDSAVVLAELAKLSAHDGAGWTTMGPAELVDHIEAAHHAYLWDELPSLEQLANKVATVHGQNHPELVEMARLVAALRADLEPHLKREERALFPMIRQLLGGAEFTGADLERGPIACMLIEHEAAGDLLAELRRVTDNYTVPADGCASYHNLFQRLETIEEDTHLHIHKENNVLFPAVVAV